MEGYYIIGTKKGKLYHLGFSGNPKELERKMVSKMRNGRFHSHPYLDTIQKHIGGNGDEDIYSLHKECGEFVEFDSANEHEKMKELGFVNVLDVRDLEREYPEHLEDVLKKAANAIKLGLISKEDFENFIDQL